MHAWQRYGLLGDETALQFVNTIDDGEKTRLVSGVGDWSALVDWARVAGVINDSESSELSALQSDSATTSELRSIHELREITWRVLRPSISKILATTIWTGSILRFVGQSRSLS